MDGDDIVPWLKSDLLSGFSDLLDTEPNNLRMGSAATLGSSDLLSLPPPAMNMDLSSDQASHADWLKSVMAGVAPSQDAVNDSQHSGHSVAQPFPGFPAAGMLTSVPTTTLNEPYSAPRSCSRLAEDVTMPTPSSWESSLSSYSLENSLAEVSHLQSAAEPREKLARKLKSEGSFACSDFDSSLQGSLCQDPCKDETITQGTANQAANNKHAPSAKASLADRNRERQQRFRQRQKAKIETLENQVTKLTAQARALAAEKEDLNGRAAKLTDLLQARDRALVTLTTQLSQIRCSGGGEPASSPQLTLTYCNPPLVLTTLQLQKMTGADLAKLWKEYVWQLGQILPKEDNAVAAQWTPTSERLDALTSELVQLMMHLWDSCPDFACIQASGMVEDTSQKPDAQGSERWQQVANSLALTQNQVLSLVALRKSMRSRLRQIWAQRREVHTNLLTCMEEDLPSSREVAMQHLKVKQNTEVLNEGIKQESLLARDFEFAFYKKVLRPEQRAQCMVRSFPLFPDTQALANWVAANNGDTEAHSMMTNHATSSTTSYHSNS